MQVKYTRYLEIYMVLYVQESYRLAIEVMFPS